MAMHVLIYPLLALAILLQAADVLLTYKIIQQGGYEKAPVAKWFINKLGVLPGLFVVKSITMGPIILATGYGYMTWWALLAFCAVYIWVVWHNFGELKK